MSTTDEVTVVPRRSVSPAPRPPRSRTATALGFIAAVLAIAFPFMPVQQDTAELHWPGAARGTDPVTAPLVALRPLELTADVACTALRDLDARIGPPAVVLSTTSPAAPAGPAVGLTVTVADGRLALVNRGVELAVVPLAAGACDLGITSTATRTEVRLGGNVVAAADSDIRPQVVSLYSDLDDDRDDLADTAVRIRVDNRFDSTVSVLKGVVGAAAVLALLCCLLALNRTDAVYGRLPAKARCARRRDVARDAIVAAVLVVWTGVGAMTADDGYILTMVRAAESAGWVGNYYRWFDVPEAPFGWFYELYGLWVQLGEAVLWLRLPALVMALASWWLLSRHLLPRLGTGVRRSRAAGWAAAALFLCFWLPFGNGLRPEPVVVLGALLATCGLEHGLATRRLTPIALGLVAAAHAVAATPTGLLAAAPFLAGLRPLLRLLRARAAATGWTPTLAPLAGAGVIVLVAVFADQTWATVAEATRVRTEIGPYVPWYGELYRYSLLFSPSPDGSLVRRFPVLVLVLCAAVAAVVLARRGRIPGVASGPARRVLGSVVLGFGVLALTPTKWTHHFGAFAGLGAAVAALAVVATGTAVLRARRNRLLAGSALLGVSAFAFTATNSWWYVSNWGVPWFDRPPGIGGVTASSAFLAGAGVLLVLAVVEHVRAPIRAGGRQARAIRGTALSGGTLAVLCGMVVLLEVTSQVKAVQKQAGSYSLAADALGDPAGCGLSAHVRIETDPAAGTLSPVPGEPPVLDGFVEGAVPASGPGSAEDVTGTGAVDPAVSASGPGVGPVLSSYRPDGGTGGLVTGWYALPAAALRDAPLVIGVAGQIGGGTSVAIELGRTTGGGVDVLDRLGITAGATITAAADPTGTAASGRGWRDVRFDLRDRSETDVVRVVASDDVVVPTGWVAVTPPRVPRLTPLLDLVGTAPGYLDWPVALPHPCLRPFDITDGIAELPRYRVLADPQQRGVGEDWSAAASAGPLAWLTVVAEQRVVPTYLDGEWGRDWGQLRLIEPYVRAASPDLRIAAELVWGWSEAAPIGEPPAGTAVGGR
ncbi:arabinosyltransferase domain-containing protein [Pseudonocardia nigra]|uniref:arabinosyltransferase domain-containing protein n=1 Tax=Pseudonocardia nigra TaxID=1921578 RepID=UPI001C5F5A2E|nr:arabinosyltransferase domain-containing protein [Pseudonocardia nigra]